jgi:homospermidine synthase
MRSAVQQARLPRKLLMVGFGELWAGGYTDPARSISQRSNYALREAVLAFARDKPQGPTALVTQGANPGLASRFVKRALINLAVGSGDALTRPQ